MGAHSEAILILAATARDAALAARTLEAGGFLPHIGRDVSGIAAKLASGAGAILLSEEAVTPDLMQTLECFLRSQPPWSDLPLVFLQKPNISTEHAPHSPALTRLREHGNLSILERPLRQPTLLYAVESAIRARRRQYQVRDLIEEKEADVRRRDEFLAMLGHELRNPLAAIRYAVDLLGEIDHQEATRTPREVIGRQTQHLARLVDDLLDVARVTRGKITLDARPLDLAELARRTVEGLENARIDGDHQITITACDEPLLIQGDAVRLEQIFSNLLFNAVKYTPAGGRIEITLTREPPGASAGASGSKAHAVRPSPTAKIEGQARVEGEVEGEVALVRFQDNGVGMSPELLARVFDLFSQAEDAIDRSRGGLGIGLTLVRGLVELHGGQITAFSEGQNRGSTFELRFPALAPAPTVAAMPVPTTPQDGRRILLVEDNPDAREVLALLLKMSGHSVECAGDGQEGFQKAVQNRPEIALVDIGLPIWDGYEFAAQTRTALGENIFLVALTGYGQPEDRRRALDAGFNEHLTKPVEPAKLRELLSRIG